MSSRTGGELLVPIQCIDRSGNYSLLYLTYSHILHLRERIGITVTSRISTVMGCVVL
jgi:hypothetical protein